MARIASNFDIQLVDGSGNPLSSGTIQFYEAGTTTPKNTYPTQADAIALTNANPNPITCDSQGRPNNSGLIDIFLLTDTKYDIVIKDSASATVKTVSNYAGTFDPTTAAYTSSDIKFNDNTGIQDSNGNEVIDVVKAGSAVNFIQAKNSATGNRVELAAAGDDTNVGIKITPKGNEKVQFNNAYAFPNADGSADQLLKTDGSGVLSFTDASALAAVPLGYIAGMKISNDTDTDHDIQIAAGVARNRGNTSNISLSSALTKRIDATWAEGDNSGGFPTALTLSANTTYYIYVIAKTDGTVDGGFDTSETAGNLLTDASDYSVYRRVGAIRTDGSNNIRNFIQVGTGSGSKFLLKTPTHDDAVTVGTTASTRVLGDIPTLPSAGSSQQAIVNMEAKHASTAAAIYVSHPDQDDDAPILDASTAPLSTIATSGSGQSQSAKLVLELNSSNQFRVRSTQSSTTVRTVSLGWIDSLDDY